MPRSYFLNLFIGLLLLCGTSLTAHSQTLGLSPAVMDAHVKRGATYTQEFTLQNNSESRLLVRCTTTDYWYDDSNRPLMGRPGTLPRSASMWVQFTPADVIIEPRSSATVKALITVPQSAAGGYYTSPRFEAVAVDAGTPATPAPGTTRARITVRFQGLLLFTTEEAVEYNIEVMSGSITPPTSSSPLEMELDVRNRGTAHARVRGTFALLDKSGKIIGRGKAAEKKYMPGQRNTFKASWLGEPPAGKYIAVITLSYDRVGMEAATLVYELPFEVGGQPPLVGQTGR